MTTPAGDHLGAIILAGGRSARFGRDKLAELLDGRPLLDHAIDAVWAVEHGIDIVVVGAPGAKPALPPGVRIAHDERAFEGPLAGLAAGLRALDADVDVAIVVGGDMPGLVPAVLRLLAGTLAAEPAIDLVMLADADSHARPLPAAARRTSVAAAAERLLAGGERRVRALAGVLTTVVVPAGTWRAFDPTGATLGDVDVPGDLPPRPTRPAVLRLLADRLVDLHPTRRVIVAIDGVDGVGKTTLADELADLVRLRRPVIRASEDDFHRPAAERYARGRASPEGFYRDSYDDDALRRELLEPFASGSDVVTGVFDHRADRPRVEARRSPAPDAVLILDGIFLHRAGLVNLWDLSILLEADFAVTVPRGAERGDGDPDPAVPSDRRYVDGQRRYLAEVDPRSRATWVIDNTDLERPRVIRGPTT